MDVFSIEVTPTATSALKNIKDKSALRGIGKKIDTLRADADLHGKPLSGEFVGLRSMPAAGRYRIIYRVERFEEPLIGNLAADSVSGKDEMIVGRVEVIAAGIRREGSRDDVYEWLSRNF